jgi:tetratricopeptide (TPR) repeat protein
LLATLGKVPEAIESLRRIVARDPLSGLAWQRLAMLLTDSGRFSEVDEAVARIRAISGDGDATFFSASPDLFQGRWQRALEEFRSQPRQPWQLLGPAMAEYSLGHPRESQQALDEAVRRYGDALSFQYAMVYAWRNDTEAAFRTLERARRIHDGGLIYLTYDRALAKLRGDPRYAALLKELNLPQQP